MTRVNRQIILARIPEGKLSLDDFSIVEQQPTAPDDGEVLIRNRLLSIDVAGRTWMQGATYRSKLLPGMLMPGGGLGEVVASRSDRFRPGDLVTGDLGWQDYAVLPATSVAKPPVEASDTQLLNLFGTSGLTAYFGLLKVGRLKRGDVVVISAAGGSVGTLTGQIARLHDCHVIGIASGNEKCRRLVKHFGFDVTLDRCSPDFIQTLKSVTPNGVDVYFDNTAGPTLEALLPRMNVHGRIVACGAVSQYDGVAPAAGPRGVPGLLITKRLTMAGFIVFDYVDDFPKAYQDLGQWLDAGLLSETNDIFDGLEKAPAALMDMLAGGNIGKRLVRVSKGSPSTVGDSK